MDVLGQVPGRNGFGQHHGPIQRPRDGAHQQGRQQHAQGHHRDGCGSPDQHQVAARGTCGLHRIVTLALLHGHELVDRLQISQHLGPVNLVHIGLLGGCIARIGQLLELVGLAPDIGTRSGHRGQYRLVLGGHRRLVDLFLHRGDACGERSHPSIKICLERLVGGHKPGHRHGDRHFRQATPADRRGDGGLVFVDGLFGRSSDLPPIPLGPDGGHQHQRQQAKNHAPHLVGDAQVIEFHGCS
ncbi:hypothetical protein ASD75_16180 [Acidovorax sp. Root568]|nr:hypothetical protein ASD75_16180 [Acidovorax sp. Root568]